MIKNLFRKLKSNSFINTQKSESKMIKNFSKKFFIIILKIKINKFRFIQVKSIWYYIL